MVFYTWHVRNSDSSSVYFCWLWLPLYYLFHVFSIVNIFKILNKLFKIAFYNFPLHASKMRGTLKSHSDSPCVTEYRNSLSNEDQGPWFPVLFFFLLLFFKSPSSRLGLETYRGVALQSWRNSWFNSLFLLQYILPMFRSSFPISSPVDAGYRFFRRVGS